MIYDKHTLTDFVLDHLHDRKWFTAKRFLNTKISEDLIDSLIGVLPNDTVCYILGSYYNSTKILLDSEKINKLFCTHINGELISGLYYFLSVIPYKNNSTHNSSQLIPISKNLSNMIFEHWSSCMSYSTLNRIIFNFEDSEKYLDYPKTIETIIREHMGCSLDDISPRKGNTVFDVFYYDQFKNNKKLISLFVYNYAFDSNPITRKMTKMIFNKDLFDEDMLALFAREIFREGQYYKSSFHGDDNSFAYSKTFVDTVLPYIHRRLDCSYRSEEVFKKLLQNKIPLTTIVKFMNTSLLTISFFSGLSSISDDDFENIFLLNRKNRRTVSIDNINDLLTKRPFVFAKHADSMIKNILTNYMKYQFPEKLKKYIDLNMIDIDIDVKVDGDGIICLEELNK